MIDFNSICNELPYEIFESKFNEAHKAGQRNIEAIAISTYDIRNKQVDSRFVNLKFINHDEFIFFSNYNSPKSLDFDSHNQISALIYWSSTNTQIRMKARINKTSKEFNQKYFKHRSVEKNALAISSDQSKPIKSFDHIIKKYEYIKNNRVLSECPEYWGGFSFKPYEIEFWEGNEFRLNKRNLYIKDNTCWNHFILEP